METQVREIYSDFDKKRKTYEAEQVDLKELEALQNLLKKKKQ